MLLQGETALRMGQLHDAERLASGILRNDKANPRATWILAHALLAQARGGEAIVLLERAARRQPDPALQTLLASALVSAERGDEALAILETVAATSVAFAPAFREHVSLLIARDRIDEAIGIARRGVSLCPDSIELRLDLAALHLRRNDRVAARDILEAARAAAPGRADILAELARAMMLDGAYAEAAETCRHALALQPDNAMTRANLAACQLELGQREAGEATLRVATKGRPQMVGRAVHALAAASHGRFFLRPSAVAGFLRGDRR